jgi:hypothetical protein
VAPARGGVNDETHFVIIQTVKERKTEHATCVGIEVKEHKQNGMRSVIMSKHKREGTYKLEETR